MKTYKCHKTVKAFKIAEIKKDSDAARIENRETDGSALLLCSQHDPNPIRVGYNYMQKHNPQVGGYYVEYEDGYASYSPAAAFEGGYTEVDDLAVTPTTPLPGVPLHREIVTAADKQLKVDILDERGAGGAHHLYRISGFDTETNPSSEILFEEPMQRAHILFQNGPIDVDGNGLNGVTHEALLDIICHRLECFQAGPYACRENALALTKLQEARHWLAHRTRARKARGVEGTHEV